MPVEGESFVGRFSAFLTQFRQKSPLRESDGVSETRHRSNAGFDKQKSTPVFNLRHLPDA
jgi:hypothetical protein